MPPPPRKLAVTAGKLQRPEAVPPPSTTHVFTLLSRAWGVRRPDLDRCTQVEPTAVAQLGVVLEFFESDDQLRTANKFSVKLEGDGTITGYTNWVRGATLGAGLWFRSQVLRGQTGRSARAGSALQHDRTVISSICCRM